MYIENTHTHTDFSCFIITNRPQVSDCANTFAEYTKTNSIQNKYNYDKM